MRSVRSQSRPHSARRREPATCRVSANPPGLPGLRDGIRIVLAVFQLCLFSVLTGLMWAALSRGQSLARKSRSSETRHGPSLWSVPRSLVWQHRGAWVFRSCVLFCLFGFFLHVRDFHRNNCGPTCTHASKGVVGTWASTPIWQ